MTLLQRLLAVCGLLLCVAPAWAAVNEDDLLEEEDLRKPEKADLQGTVVFELSWDTVCCEPAHHNENSKNEEFFRNKIIDLEEEIKQLSNYIE